MFLELPFVHALGVTTCCRLQTCTCRHWCKTIGGALNIGKPKHFCFVSECIKRAGPRRGGWRQGRGCWRDCCFRDCCWRSGRRDRNYGDQCWHRGANGRNRRNRRSRRCTDGPSCTGRETAVVSTIRDSTSKSLLHNDESPARWATFRKCLSHQPRIAAAQHWSGSRTSPAAWAPRIKVTTLYDRRGS